MIELPPEMRFVLASLAVWRLTHLVVAEDGPWDLIVRLRAIASDSAIGAAMDCFYCASLWLALPFAFVVAGDVPSAFIAWLALSGAALLLERSHGRETPSTPGMAAPPRQGNFP